MALFVHGNIVVFIWEVAGLAYLPRSRQASVFFSFAEQNLGFFLNLACPLDFQVAFVILILLAWDFLCLY